MGIKGSCDLKGQNSWPKYLENGWI